MIIIDINFNMFSDTPKGKDPDSYSPTLRSYHKILWSKPLPNGISFYYRYAPIIWLIFMIFIGGILYHYILNLK